MNPIVGAARSNTLTSHKNGECSGERAHIGEHDPYRGNTQGNVFNRLGREADMMETLNRRIE